MERSSGLNIFPRSVGSQNQYSSVKYCSCLKVFFSGRGHGVGGGFGVEE